MSQERKLARVGLPDLGWSAGGGGAPSGSKSAFAQLINNRDPISGKHGCFGGGSCCIEYPYFAQCFSVYGHTRGAKAPRVFLNNLIGR